MRLRDWVVGLILLLAGGAAGVGAETENLSFHGNLVADPCTIQPGDETINLDFATIVDKYLYLNQRTHSKPFQLHLKDCDTSLGNSVKIMFSGTESQSLPGLLALGSGSSASGVAIGMETEKGKALPLNKNGEAWPLKSGENVLTFQVYVQGEPDAITHKSITRGEFTASTTFLLEYD